MSASFNQLRTDANVCIFTSPLPWQGHHKTCSISIAGVEHHVAPQAAGNAAGHGKADARSVVEVVELHELLEDMLRLILRYTYARVLNGEAHLPS